MMCSLVSFTASSKRSPASVVINTQVLATLSGFVLGICTQKRFICDILVRGGHFLFGISIAMSKFDCLEIAP